MVSFIGRFPIQGVLYREVPYSGCTLWSAVCRVTSGPEPTSRAHVREQIDALVRPCFIIGGCYR